MNWQVVFIGIIAFSVLIIAIGQIVLAIALARVAKQALTAITQLQTEVRPLLDKVNRIADDAGRVSQLAVIQAERLDEFVTTTSTRVDETLSLLQKKVIRPVRQGAAMMAAIRAALSVIRAWQRRPAQTRDDEDPLFVG